MQGDHSAPQSRPPEAAAGAGCGPRASAAARSGASSSAGDSTASIDELFSILSHELRAPLTTIKGSSRTLLRHFGVLEPGAARQMLADIDQEADRLHRLIDNLLQLARVGAGASALKTEPTSLDVLIRKVVADQTPRAGSRRLRVRVPADLPRADVDPVRIEQVLRNLIDNAVKFTADGGVIDVTATTQSSLVVVAVKDDGPGIPLEYQQRVFERFFRVEREHGSVPGAGLGLAICRRFVELHGGDIELDSRPGQGATFRFTLPLGQRAASFSASIEACGS